ncbi:hypothetical protein VP22O281_P0020 [Vibrio phage 22O28-1]|nr:hypothetical protein VP22O281_P0020 [Vibrio phage 22O28-1]
MSFLSRNLEIGPAKFGWAFFMRLTLTVNNQFYTLALNH